MKLSKKITTILGIVMSWFSMGLGAFIGAEWLVGVPVGIIIAFLTTTEWRENR